MSLQIEVNPRYIAGIFPVLSVLQAQTPTLSRLFSFQKPYLFDEDYQIPQRGIFTYSSGATLVNNFTYQNGFSAKLRSNYVTQNSLQNIIDLAFRASGDHKPVFVYAHDFGMVSSASVLYTSSSVQQPMVRYLYSTGTVFLQPWWKVCYGDIFSMIQYHFNDYTTSQQLAYDFDAQLKADVDAYYSANMAMVFSNSGPSTPIMYSNGYYVQLGSYVCTGRVIEDWEGAITDWGWRERC